MMARPGGSLVVYLNTFQVVLDHGDAVGAQALGGNIANVPIDDTTKGECAKASAAFFAVQDATFLMRAMPALLP
jgi:hypothetical protein